MTKQSTTFFNVVLISSLGLSVSCSKPTNQASNKNTFSTVLASQLLKEGKAEEAAEMYSRIGEILLSRPEGIVHAQVMFQKSLELNPNDNKANIYSALISPALTAKGFLTRFKNPSENSSETSQMIALEKKILASGVKEFIDFALVLPEGKKAAKNMEDIRKFYRREYTKELGNSIDKLENIKSDKFSVDLNISSYGSNKIQQSAASCILSGNEVYNCEELQAPAKRNIDSYDLKALKIILKTEKNALTIAYSIGLEGFEEAATKLGNIEGRTDKEVVNAIKSQPNLLKIEGSKEDLRQIFDHTEEVMNDLIDFTKISKEICYADNNKSNIAETCLSEAASERINEILMYTVGPKAFVIGHDKNNEEVLVDVNLRALMDSKVTSLQELLPNEFDSAGKAVNVKDLTFSGIIPNADLISKLKTVVK